MKHKEYNRELGFSLAKRLGLVIAALWSLSFLIVVTNFPSFLAELGYIIGLLPIFVMSRNLRGVRTFVMPVSWAQCFALALLAFLGGTLITTLVQFLYFAYMDHGHFMHAMLENLRNPAMIEAMKQAGSAETLKQMTALMEDIAALSPRDLTLQMFTSNLTFSFFFSLLASLFGIMGGRKLHKQE